MVKTKIICTIGPASSNVNVLRKMMLAGMDVARLNFSHGSHEEQQKRIILIRQLNKKYRRRIRILQDLEGPRVRVGKFKGKKEVELKKRQTLFLSNQEKAESKNFLPFDYEGDLKKITKGSHIYIDDGKIFLQVVEALKDKLKVKVVVGGIVRENKGINIPQVDLKFEGLSIKDQEDIEFAIEQGVDYIAQSFVRSRSDILQIRDFIGDRLPRCRLIAKIENRMGIDNIDGIVDASDGIMIARGDMGVSIPVYEMPIVQKQIIRKCNKKKKFVITATQMLESMVDNIRPSRAEVTDIANAIIDGTDYVMLSAETATGMYPVKCVDMMNNIIKYTEEAIAKKII